MCDASSEKNKARWPVCIYILHVNAWFTKMLKTYVCVSDNNTVVTYCYTEPLGKVAEYSSRESRVIRIF